MSVEKLLNELIQRLIIVCGDNLKSVILYGSHASGEHSQKNSDYNLLVVFDKVKFSELDQLKKQLKKWVRQDNPVPVLFEKSQFTESVDVFPIEFLDMKDNHKILYGEDPFVDMKVNDKHLRHEIEFELRGKLLKLKQGYMMADSNSDVRRLMIRSLSTFLVLFKHVLRLYGQVPPMKRIDALNALADKTGLKPDVFMVVYNIKHGDVKSLKDDPDMLMEEYIGGIEKIIEIVDKM
jgi:predicted nucleotidyltransferase